MKVVYFLGAILAFAISIVSAYDPSPLQDICVATNETNGVYVNGKFCKDPKLVNADDFFIQLGSESSTANPLGLGVTPATVLELPGLNTLGISMARIDYAPKGLNPPHTHPRGSETLIVIKGTLFAGFVTSNQDNNRLFTKILNEGDAFVFPLGLIHFQYNVGNGSAIAFSSLNSQNAGIIGIPNAVFRSTPPISNEILAKAFQVEEKVIELFRK